MKREYIIFFFLTMLAYALLPMTILMAQVNDTKPLKKGKAEKEAEELLTFAKINSLVNSRQFVFEADFSQGSDEIFIVVDSLYAMVQNGNRNNLEGQITQCKVKKDDKRRTISITFLMRGAMSTADVFIFLGESGRGTATIKSDFPGYFTFNGFLVDYENAQIYAGGSHFVH